MTPPTENGFFTVEQVAERLGLHPNAIYAEVKAGRLPVLRLGPRGGKLRITEEGIAAYLDACKSSPPPARRRLKFIKTRSA